MGEAQGFTIPFTAAAYRIPERPLPLAASREEAAREFYAATGRSPEVVTGPDGAVHHFVAWCAGCGVALFLSGTTAAAGEGRRACRGCAAAMERRATGQEHFGFYAEAGG